MYKHFNYKYFREYTNQISICSPGQRRVPQLVIYIYERTGLSVCLSVCLSVIYARNNRWTDLHENLDLDPS